MSNPWIEDPLPVVPASKTLVRSSPVWVSGARVRDSAVLPVVYGRSSGVWVVGAHGGAGVSTLARVWGCGDGGVAWPVSVPPSRVIVVARTHRHGLESARRAAIQWATGGVDAHLLGLVLVADSPKPVRGLRDLQRFVAGAFPKVWEVGWVEAWRSQLPSDSSAPRHVRRLFRDITGVMERTHS